MPRSTLARGKLAQKVALVTGGDSGIGRAVAVLSAREGAHIGLAYLDEHQDAAITKEMAGEILPIIGGYSGG
jgi:NAD(P)-dependent dehydrogenase (short-subunit alcohol dehydrogenase family)